MGTMHDVIELLVFVRFSLQCFTEKVSVHLKFKLSGQHSKKYWQKHKQTPFNGLVCCLCCAVFCAWMYQEHSEKDVQKSSVFCTLNATFQSLQYCGFNNCSGLNDQLHPYCMQFGCKTVQITYKSRATQYTVFGISDIHSIQFCTKSSYIWIILDCSIFLTKKIRSNEVTQYVRGSGLSLPLVH